MYNSNVESGSSCLPLQTYCLRIALATKSLPSIVCSSFFVKAWAFVQALRWSRQHQQNPSLLFPSPRLPLSQTLWKIWQKLSFLTFFTIKLQWVPGYLFLKGNNAADELARRGALVVPFAIHCSLSLLVSGIHSCFLLDCRRTVSSKFFDTQVTSVSTEELLLPRQARCVLSRLRCSGHSLLLNSYLTRIDRFENPSCRACGHPSQNNYNRILHCPATCSLRRSLFDDFLSLYDLWSRPRGFMVFRYVSSLGRGWVTTKKHQLP